MRRKRNTLIMAGLAALTVLESACSRGNEAATASQIQSLPATVGTVRNSVTFVGNVTSSQSSSLSWRTQGVIETVNVKLGDSVKEGDILAVLETSSLQSTVLNAEDPLITAEEELEELLESETPKAKAYKDLKDKEAAYIEAQNYQVSLQYPNASATDIEYYRQQAVIQKQYYDEAVDTLNHASEMKQNSDAYKKLEENVVSTLSNYATAYNAYLYYSGSASENDQEQAAADIDVAKAAYELALKTFASYTDYPREKDIAAAEAKLDSAQDTYNRRNIVADINGVVTVLDMRAGDYVTKGDAAVQLDNTEALYIPMDISELDVVKIYDGMPAVVKLDANSEKEYQGVVTTVSASGDSSTFSVTFGTVVKILDPDDQVKIGMTAEVDLILEEENDALLVPQNALYTENGKTYVHKTDGTNSEAIEVTVGVHSDSVAAITGGALTEGDKIEVPSVDTSVLEAMGLDNSYLMGNMPGGQPPEGMPGMPPSADQAGMAADGAESMDGNGMNGNTDGNVSQDTNERPEITIINKE